MYAFGYAKSIQGKSASAAPAAQAANAALKNGPGQRGHGPKFKQTRPLSVVDLSGAKLKEFATPSLWTASSRTGIFAGGGRTDGDAARRRAPHEVDGARPVKPRVRATRRPFFSSGQCTPTSSDAGSQGKTTPAPRPTSSAAPRISRETFSPWAPPRTGSRAGPDCVKNIPGDRSRPCRRSRPGSPR